MVDLPDARGTPVVRADFSDDDVWERLKEEISSPTADGFLAGVEFIEERALSGADEAAIVAEYPRCYPRQYQHPVLFVIDAVAVSRPEHPLLVINLNERDDAGPFRTLPRQVQSIENNLSLANMGFFEFARAVGSDGVFRGF
jgi:hypothetical protein